MSQPRSSRAGDKADAAEFWDRTPEQLKSYDKGRQIEARSEEARWKLQKDRIVTWWALLGLVAVFVVCAYAIVTGRDPGETQPAWAILSSMIAGAVSFFAGKAAAR